LKKGEGWTIYGDDEKEMKTAMNANAVVVGKIGGEIWPGRCWSDAMY